MKVFILVVVLVYIKCEIAVAISNKEKDKNATEIQVYFSLLLFCSDIFDNAILEVSLNLNRALKSTRIWRHGWFLI